MVQLYFGMGFFWCLYKLFVSKVYCNVLNEGIHYSAPAFTTKDSSIYVNASPSYYRIEVDMHRPKPSNIPDSSSAFVISCLLSHPPYCCTSQDFSPQHCNYSPPGRCSCPYIDTHTSIRTWCSSRRAPLRASRWPCLFSSPRSLSYVLQLGLQAGHPHPHPHVWKTVPVS